MSGKASSGNGVLGSSSETLSSSSSGPQVLEHGPNPGYYHPLLDAHRVPLVGDEGHLGRDGPVLAHVPGGVRGLGPPVRAQVVDPAEAACDRKLPVELGVLPAGTRACRRSRS